jgi:minor extracellular serine protease Vpr
VNATSASVALDPVSVSFGSVPAGSGQSRSINVTLNNIGSAWQTLSLSTSGGNASVSFGVSTASVTLAPGASATVQVTMNAVKGAAVGHHQGSLEVRAGATSVAHAVIFAVAK